MDNSGKYGWAVYLLERSAEGFQKRAASYSAEARSWVAAGNSAEANLMQAGASYEYHRARQIVKALHDEIGRLQRGQ